MAIQMVKKGAAASGKSAASGSGQAMSLRPSDQVSEGLIDDMDVTFETLEFTLEAPPNYSSGDSVPLFVKAHLVPVEGEPLDQWWSAGDSSKFQPSDDGKSAVRVKGSGGIGSGTNVAALFRSIVDAGFPEDRITGDLSCFEGMVAHVRQVAQPKRKGLPRQEENQRERTILCVEKIVKLPWETGKGAGRAGAGTSASASASASSKSNGESSDEELALEVVAAILEKAGGPVDAKKLPAKAFLVLSQPKFKQHKSGILKLLGDAEFVSGGAESGAYDFDGEQVSPAQ